MSAPITTLHPVLNNINMSSKAHQLVVIARPSPDQPYCQLASAFQSCHCSRNILRPCLNALRALSDDRNRFGISQEVKFAAEYQPASVGANPVLPADYFYQVRGQKDADHQFPYINATLFSSMATCCLAQKHAGYRCSLGAPFHSVKTGFRASGDALYEDCTTDITVGVVDITDLSKPRYCFLNMDMKCIKCGLWWFDIVRNNIMDDMAQWNNTEYMPLSCDAFPPAIALESQSTVQSQSEAGDVEVMEALRSYPLVDVAAISSCWPSSAWNSSQRLEASSNQPQVSVYQGQAAPRRGPRSLSEHAQSKTLDAILSELLDDLDLLDDQMMFKGLQKSFLGICAARVEELAAFERQETIAELLSRLLEGAEHVDFYPFRKLPMTTILEVLNSDRLRNVKSLNLSGLFAGAPERIWTTLDTIPHQTEVVYLLSPPSAEKASEDAAVIRSMPPFIGRDGFWERMGSKKIIMSACISTALLSYCATHPGVNLGWKQMYLRYLRELISGDALRLQLVPHTTWWTQ